MKPMSAKPSVYRPELEAPEPDAWLEPQNMNQNRTVRHRSVRVPKTARARSGARASRADRGPTIVFDHIASAMHLFEKF